MSEVPQRWQFLQKTWWCWGVLGLEGTMCLLDHPLQWFDIYVQILVHNDLDVEQRGRALLKLKNLRNVWEKTWYMVEYDIYHHWIMREILFEENMMVTTWYDNWYSDGICKCNTNRNACMPLRLQWLPMGSCLALHTRQVFLTSLRQVFLISLRWSTSCGWP